MKMLLWLLVLGQCTFAGPLPWIDLSGEWKITNGDNMSYARRNFDDSRWTSITLPGIDLNRQAGYFWLRRTVRLAPDATGRPLTLALGRIAENYEVYGNGALVGAVGNFTKEAARIADPVPSISRSLPHRR